MSIIVIVEKPASLYQVVKAGEAWEALGRIEQELGYKLDNAEKFQGLELTGLELARKIFDGALEQFDIDLDEAGVKTWADEGEA